MVAKSVSIVDARSSRKIARRNLNLAKKLFKEKDYYDWSVVVLFYSAYSLVKAICQLNGVAPPSEHKGYYNNKTQTYIYGMLDMAKKYLTKKAYDSYSQLLVQSQLLRYNSKYTILFQDDVRVRSLVKKLFQSYELVINDFNKKYNRK